MTASAKRQGTTERQPRDRHSANQAWLRPRVAAGVAGALDWARAKRPSSVPAPRPAADAPAIAERTEGGAAAIGEQLTVSRSAPTGDDILLPGAQSAAVNPAGLIPGLGWIAGRRARRVVWGVLAAEVAVVVVFAVVYRPFDLAIYLWGGRAVTHGLRLYAVQVRGNWFTYPPFAAALFTPLSFLPPMLVGLAWELGTVAALAWSALVCLRLAGYRPTATAIAAVTAAAVALEPVYHTLYLGQVNVFLLALVLADIRRVAAGRSAGIGIGLATAVKLIPGLFIVFLAAVGRWKDASIAAVTFLAAAAAGYLVNPAASKLYWTKLFDDTSRVSATYISNQTPYAALCRILGGTSHVGPWYLAITALIALTGTATAARLATRGDWLAAATLTGITALLVSPISWTHHWVWALPALLILLTRTTTTAARITTAAVYALYVIAPMWFTPWANDSAQLGFHGADTLIANCYLITGLAYLTWMTVGTWRPHPARQQPDVLVPIMDEATA
jgi:hypothetical protein